MLGPRLLRVKGLVATAELPDRPLVIQGAQHVFHPPRRLPAWPDGLRATRLVVISDGLDSAEVEHLWRALVSIPEIDRPDLAALTENPLAPRRAGLF
jgi:G3E family GTPase